ncbi:MAG: hypothetical protein ACK413_03265, partial [Patescibacteria group bacterium]
MKQKIMDRRLFFLAIIIVLFFVLAPRGTKAIDCCICRRGRQVVSCPEIRIPGTLWSDFNDPL